MLLAIDTATRLMSLALHDGDDLIAEQTWHAGNQHSVLLAPGIKSMLRACDLQMDDLTALAVSVGPGSYTGLRIGVALAKGMAAVHQLPLIGVTTLDTLAAGQPFSSTRTTLMAVVQAGRGRVIASQYRVKRGRWQATTEPELMNWPDVFAAAEGPVYLTGEVNADGRAALQAAQENDSDLSITLMAGTYRLRRAGFLAEEAWRQFRDGKPEDFRPGRVQPLYVKSD